MKYWSAVLIITFTACGNLPELDGDQMAPDIPRTEQIQFPCNQFNGSIDWVSCTPVRIDLSSYPPLASATMTYVMATTRGSSFMIAELYDVTNGQSILLSDVISNQSSLYSKPTSENIVDYLPKEPVELVIRFRNSEDGPEGYINNYSYLTLTYQ